MSGPNDTTIDVEDEAVVSIDVTDAPELAEAAALGAEGAEADEGRVAAKPGAAAVAEPDDGAQAQAALQEAIDKANKGREAAEATARAERQRAEEASRLLASRDADLRTSQETAQQREAELLDTSIENAQRELDASQIEHRNAMEAGDFAAASVANGKMAKAAAKVDRLEAAKADVESGKTKRPTTEGRVEAQPEMPQKSPFEWYVSQYVPSAQAWLRAHPQCVPPDIRVNGQTIHLGGDKVKNAEMMMGHYETEKRGIPANTPEYFAVIEKYISDTPVAAAAEPVSPAPKPKLRQAQPSAPPSREPPNNNGTPNKRSVTLNREQQEVARTSFPDKPVREAYALYARNLLELQAEGKIGRTSH